MNLDAGGLYFKAPGDILMEKAVCCTRCQSIGLEKYIRSGSVRMGILLLFFFVVPGVLYLLWHLGTGNWGCSTCGSRAIVPIEDFDATHAIEGNSMNPEERMA